MMRSKCKKEGKTFSSTVPTSQDGKEILISGCLLDPFAPQAGGETLLCVQPLHLLPPGIVTSLNPSTSEHHVPAQGVG